MGIYGVVQYCFITQISKAQKMHLMKKEKSKPKFRSVWVIDDEGIDLFLAERIFSTYAEVESLYLEKNAVTALEKLSRISRRRDYPDLLLLDVEMKMMNGFAFLDAVAKMPLFIASGCHLCLISAYFSPIRYTDEAKEYPFINKLITKPLRAKHLAGMN